ncbi:hypothetical protein SEVIR_5G029600v4 [Setaria viridis]|uniref:Uncharacterized protein n=1 Tax=Setaria viridis TaxID=4556 RepID=A0A4U6U9F5_SETVI|nr:nuclear envelope-associated protein 2-like isoform X2 [Setaria viridis]TKW12337.1 hypothetical protein SEVIR_5G029600v2 [Setaria viridis]TKW12338.1 hypothetical protein SEVIR_5G029600v2 [Setaria viridis]TKW12339.1 hypothetical protein SEVIR_5G029600v2 [Setaria viridis]
MPVSERATIPSSLSSSLELNPLLRDLVEKKLSLKRSVTSMAAELKDARNRLASKELLYAQELEARKATDLEDEVNKMQKCLEDKEEQLRASLSINEQCRRKLDDLRSQLLITQTTAESTAASANSGLLHCSSLLEKLNDNENSLSEATYPVGNVAEQLNHFHEYLKSRDPSRGHIKDYYLTTESDIMNAFAKAGVDNVNELMKIMSDVSPKNSENINEDLIFEDDGNANLREGIRVLSAHWENKIKELESQLDKHVGIVQELKRWILKLEFSLQEPRSRLRKLQRVREKRSKALTLKELRNQAAMEQPSGGGSGDKQNLGKSSGFKLIASMSMLVLFILAKR